MLLFQLLQNQIDIVSFLIFAVAIVVGITIHEFAHAASADRLGDPTARLAGRLTLNPTAHLDPLGTVMILLVGIGFGKPTPFDPFNLQNIKRDSAIISVSGAAANFFLAILLSLPYLVAALTGNLSVAFTTVYNYLSVVIFLNIILAVFNLIPIAPLDGFKVLAGFLPKGWYYDWQQMERYGPVILLLLIALNFLGFPILSTLIFKPSETILSLLLPQGF